MLINLNSNSNIPDRLDTTTAVAVTSVPSALIVVVISRSYIICVYSTLRWSLNILLYVIAIKYTQHAYIHCLQAAPCV